MNFGKRCMIFVCLINILLISNAWAGSKQDDLLKAIEYTPLELAGEIVKLNQISEKYRVHQDINIAKVKSALPKLSATVLKHAIFYINMNNFANCIKKSEQRVLWLPVTLENLIRKAQSIGVEINATFSKAPDSATALLVGVSEEFSVASIRYSSLPASAREKIESIDELKKGSFDVFNLIKKLGLE